MCKVFEPVNYSKAQLAAWPLCLGGVKVESNWNAFSWCR